MDPHTAPEQHRMPCLSDAPRPGLRPYPRSVADIPDAFQAVPDLLRQLLAEEGSVMVTTWVVACEFIDEDGSPNFAAWSSDDPPWRIQGLMSHGADLLDLSVEFDLDDEDLDD